MMFVSVNNYRKSVKFSIFGDKRETFTNCEKQQTFGVSFCVKKNEDRRKIWVLTTAFNEVLYIKNQSTQVFTK